jgi:hypothetical protein
MSKLQRVLLAVVVAAMLLAVGTTAKGSFGYTRSSGGGYVRASKTGYYSRTNRYYVTGMYWRSGYYYSSFRGSATRARATTLTPEDMDDVMCVRSVELNGAPMPTSIAFNSTRKCFKELYAQPGHPGNADFDSVMLDRYQFRFSTAPFPQVDLLVFPDKDIDVPTFNASLRFTELTFPLAHDRENPAATAPFSLKGLSWQTCDLNDACTNGAPTISSRHLDGATLSVVSFRSTFTTASGPSGTITLRFWLTNDFAEDPIVENVFLLPSMVKVDVEVVQTSPTAHTTMHTGIKALLVVAGSGEGSDLTPVPTMNISTAYNPKAMNRIEIGTTIDQQNGNAGMLSWWGSAAWTEPLCRPEESVLWPCSNFITGFVKNQLKQKVVCSKDASGAFSNTNVNTCDAGLLRDSQTAYELSWVLDRKTLQVNQLNPVVNQQTHAWYLDFGYWDPAQGVQADIPTAAASRHMLPLTLGFILLLIF